MDDETGLEVRNNTGKIIGMEFLKDLPREGEFLTIAKMYST